MMNSPGMKFTRRLARLGLAAMLVLASLASPGRAQQPVPGQAPGGQVSRSQMMSLMRDACGQDYRTHCHGVRPGGGRALSCLRANQAMLSKPCQMVLQKASHSR
jgi:hypothetical protein